MFPFLFVVISSVSFNAQVCAVNPASTASVLEAMKPNACVGREETYNVNK